MRRQLDARARTVGNVLRSLLATAAVGCVLFVCACLFWPAPIDAWFDQLRRKPADRVLHRWNQLARLADDDPRLADELATFWSDLSHTRKEDRLAVALRVVGRRMVTAAEARSDFVTAHAAARALYEFDDRDLVSIGALARALASTAETRDEAIELLRATQRRVPDDRVIVTTLFEQLVAAGEADAAIEVLERAARHQQSNLWQVQWSDRPHDTAWFVPLRLSATRIGARFTIENSSERLRLILPEFGSFELSDLEVWIERADGVVEPLAEVAQHSKLTAIRRDGERLIATGAEFAAIDLATSPSNGGELTVTIAAELRMTLPQWLCELVRGDVGDALVHRSDLDERTRRTLDTLRSEAGGR